MPVVPVTKRNMDSVAAQPKVETVPEFQSLPVIAPGQRWVELCLVILIAIAPLILNAVVALLYPRSGPRSGFSPALRVASVLLHEVSSLFLVVYLLHRRGESLRTLGLAFNRWTDIFRGLGLTLGGLFLSAILSMIVRSSSMALTGHPAEMRDPRVIFAGLSTSGFVVYSCGAAVFEETIVRAYLTAELIALAAPVWLATLTSIVLQTSYHVYYGLGGALALSGVFIVFGIYFANTRRLLPVILGHLFMDLWATWVNLVR